MYTCLFSQFFYPRDPWSYLYLPELHSRLTVPPDRRTGVAPYCFPSFCTIINRNRPQSTARRTIPLCVRLQFVVFFQSVTRPSLSLRLQTLIAYSLAHRMCHDVISGKPIIFVTHFFFRLGMKHKNQRSVLLIYFKLFCISKLRIRITFSQIGICYFIEIKLVLQ